MFWCLLAHSNQCETLKWSPRTAKILDVSCGDTLMRYGMRWLQGRKNKSESNAGRAQDGSTFSNNHFQFFCWWNIFWFTGLPKFDFVGGFIPVYRFPPHAPHGPASISSIAQVWPCMPPLRGNRWAAKRGILKDDSNALAMFMTWCCWEHLSPLSPNGTTIHPTALY